MTGAEKRARRRRTTRILWSAGALSVVLAVPTLNAIAPSSALRLDAEVDRQAAVLERGGFLTRTGDERLLRRHILLDSARPIDVLAIGSSRSNPIGVEAVGTDSFVNVSASFGTFFDVAALYAILDEADRWPERLIVAPDPWSLNARIEQQSWRVYGDDVDRGLDLIGLDGAFDWARMGVGDRAARAVDTLGALTEPADFQAHALSMAGRVLRDPSAALTIDFEARPATVADRSSIWGPDLAFWYSCLPPDRVDAYVAAFMTAEEGPPLGWMTDGWTENAPELLDLFDRLIGAFQARGVEVSILIPPIHPDAFAAMGATPQRRLWMEADAAFRSVAVARGARVIGGLDPAESGLTRADFCSDAVHVRPPVMARVFEASGWEARP